MLNACTKFYYASFSLGLFSFAFDFQKQNKKEKENENENAVNQIFPCCLKIVFSSMKPKPASRVMSYEAEYFAAQNVSLRNF